MKRRRDELAKMSAWLVQMRVRFLEQVLELLNFYRLSIEKWGIALGATAICVWIMFSWRVMTSET